MSYRSLLPEEMIDREPDFSKGAVRDARDGSVYLVDKPLRLAVDAALSTGRPLLLRGEPGSGKSSLAPYIARVLHWRYYEHVVTSRTTALDLLWGFDSVRKLADASLARTRADALDDHNYVEPGVLWWAMDPESARRRGASGEMPLSEIREVEEPNLAINAARAHDRAVVLIDEIDKADPDVPNGLLVPLGSSEFRVAETSTIVTGRTVAADGTSNIFVVLTTNEERDLPPALLRRCISYVLKPADLDRMLAIGRKHVAASRFLAEHVDDKMLADLANIIISLRSDAEARAIRPPSTAEFLDAVWACASLGIRTTDAEWADLQNLVLWKGERV